ncbi:MAG: NTP transferase domain-containing protein [Deltaproteobacteria bacterium]|nr:NTP transferase domain-containing protein [Deltaproteobacteria bacterium]
MTEITDKKRNIASIILAAGKGTRMQSSLPKVLHTINNKTLLSYVIDLAQSVHCEKTVVIVGYQIAAICEAFRDVAVVFAEQKEQLGTAHAAAQAQAELTDFSGDIFILCGDVPLLKKETLLSLLNVHIEQNADVTVMTTIVADPASYGRVVKNDSGAILRIVEFRDATTEEKKIAEINTGIYCVRAEFLFRALASISNLNQQGEYYLTDIIAVAVQEKKRAVAFILPDYREAIGINSMEELEIAKNYLDERKHA